VTNETVENCIGVSALLVFALFYLVPSWRSAISDMLAGIGLVFFAFGIPYSVSQPARTRRQRAALMFFGLGGVMFILMAVAALLPSRFADHGAGFWILEALILPTGIAMFTLPFLFLHVANRVDVRRYRHVVEYHPLLARLVWEPQLGPKPLGGIYRRRCECWFCLFR
jgi:hypothetical protein